MDLKKGSLTFKGFKIIDFLLMRVFGFFSKANLQNTINYYKIDEEDNSIELDFNGKQKLYAIKLDGANNEKSAIDNFYDLTKRIKFLEEAQVMISFVKTKKTQAIYVFSLNKDILLSICEYFSAVKLLTPNEIICAIYHIFLLDVYEIREKQLLSRYEDNDLTEKPDLLFKEFSSLITIASDNILQNYTPFQVTAFKNSTNFSTIDFFSANWEGVCHLFFDFTNGKVTSRLNMLEKTAKLSDPKYMKEYKEITIKDGNQEAARLLNEDCFIANGIFFLKDKNTANNFQNLLGVIAEERYFNIEKILPKTLLLTRDIDFDIIVENNIIGKYFTTTLYRDCIKILHNRGESDHDKFLITDFYGTDINGSFFNYSFKQNDNPHCLIFGTTGAGKSVAALRIFAQLIDYDYKQKTAMSLNENRKIRYLNVGYTGGRFFENIAKSPKGSKLIEILPSTISDMKFNLFDFDDLQNPTEDEITTFVSFINLMLSIKGSNSLTASEEAELIKALKKVISLDELGRVQYPQPTLREIQQSGNGAYDKIIKEILDTKDENGNPIYTLDNRTHEIPADYQPLLNRPTMRDLINIVDAQSHSQYLNQTEQKINEDLKTKINIFKASAVFSSYSNVFIKGNFPCRYVDFESIKGNPEYFVAIGWLLLKNWTKQDKAKALEAQNAGLKRPDCFYFIDEAHNFLRIPVFDTMLEILAREVRKFGIHLIFITQEVRDFREEVVELFASKMFLFVKAKKDTAYKSITITNGGKDLSPKAQEVFDKIENGETDINKTIFLSYTFGTVAFKLPAIEKQYMNLFGPYEIK
ncbi:hypothetical protein [Campylobacter sp. JMF_03 NE3]|uniref:hypothetical protein n=1 Tax=Campylobacter sp. JMF_03 NE3 TaxID=2983831 RepID=UPI0022E9A3F2|nr:hypothetical protein [Campylobacter sp. JMF_03 NE3]MDA3053689.1 hypothetical protein [Campylobacter sp. JMF_03 NE3]